MADRKSEKKKAVVIGAGFAGLSAACCLAQDGWDVTVVEKNEQLGGRCRTWEKDGFKGAPGRRTQPRVLHGKSRGGELVPLPIMPTVVGP